MSPAVSVVMAAYNASKFIEDAITSAQAQTLEDFELIVVDDCSTDTTIEIVERMAASDPRIRLLRMTENGGPGAARHLAISNTTGEWVAIQDADDMMLPDRLEKLVGVAQEHNFDVICDNLYYVDEDSGERFGTALPVVDKGAISTISAEQFVLSNLPGETGFKLGFLKPVIRRALLVESKINYQKRLRVAEDYQFIFEILVTGARFGFYNECLYDYVIRPASLSHTYSEVQLLQIAEVNREAIENPAVAKNPATLAAVKQRQIYCDRNSAFVRILGRVKARQPIALLITIFQTRPYFTYIIWRIFRVLTEGRVWGSRKPENTGQVAGSPLEIERSP